MLEGKIGTLQAGIAHTEAGPAVYRGNTINCAARSGTVWCKAVCTLSTSFPDPFLSQEAASRFVAQGDLPCWDRSRRSPPTPGVSFDHSGWKSGALSGRARAKEASAAPGALNLATINVAEDREPGTEFAARSKAQKCRPLQPDGGKTSHGVYSCPSSFVGTTTISTKSPAHFP